VYLCVEIEISGTVEAQC